MKITKIKPHVIIMFTLSLSSIYGQELDKKLKLLEPFINTQWEAREQGFGDEGKIEMSFDILENGKVIQRTDTIKAINSTSVYFYFWDFDKLEIGVFGIYNNGNFVHGHLKEEEGKILFYGYGTFPNLKLEFRNTYELSEDGKFIDKYFRYEDGKWKPGHSRVYHPIKEKQDNPPLNPYVSIRDSEMIPDQRFRRLQQIYDVQGRLY